MTKITRKNSFYFNQEWLDKTITEGNINFLPYKQIPGLSIGEYIEAQYESVKEQQKVTEHNSILYTSEWLRKFNEENFEVLAHPCGEKYSFGEILSLSYYTLELRKRINKAQEKTLSLCIR